MSIAQAVELRNVRQELDAAITLIKTLSAEIDALKDQMKQLQAKRHEQRR